MKLQKIKTTSKKTNFEVFKQLSSNDLICLRGGNNETPPDHNDPEKSE